MNRDVRLMRWRTYRSDLPLHAATPYALWVESPEGPDHACLHATETERDACLRVILEDAGHAAAEA